MFSLSQHASFGFRVLSHRPKNVSMCIGDAQVPLALSKCVSGAVGWKINKRISGSTI